LVSGTAPVESGWAMMVSGHDFGGKWVGFGGKWSAMVVSGQDFDSK